MRNHLKVKIGNNHPSIFYWHEANSIDNLKKCIEKRFQIPISCQEIIHNGNVLNTEKYEKRLQIDVELEIEFNDESIDSAMVYNQRNLAVQKEESGIRNILISNATTNKSAVFKFDSKDLSINTTIMDLKKTDPI